MRIKQTTYIETLIKVGSKFRASYKSDGRSSPILVVSADYDKMLLVDPETGLRYGSIFKVDDDKDITPKEFCSGILCPISGFLDIEFYVPELQKYVSIKDELINA